MQKPKKLDIRASDGMVYSLLCKPKDDLRQDSRMMEFNILMNQILRQRPDSRRRDLYVRTYSVTPLNETCGLVEWVPNMEVMRSALLRMYAEKPGTGMSMKDLRDHAARVEESKNMKLRKFKDILAQHPSVLGHWFQRNFIEPSAWHQARLAFTRTTAVMCMIGYVVGLGDRHGENILMDKESGDILHVDFSCLFQKGETLGVPEVVPFRLTHNIVHGFGPLGIEGIYRTACEVTMRTIRKERSMLSTVLQTFLHDPLLDWKDKKGRDAKALAAEYLQNIDTRLKGCFRSGLDILSGKSGSGKSTSSHSNPLSVEGQVNLLIQDAMDDGLLCEMYIGWAAYM